MPFAQAGLSVISNALALVALAAPTTLTPDQLQLSLARLDVALSAVLPKKGKPALAEQKGVNRTRLIEELHKRFVWAKPSFQFSPWPEELDRRSDFKNLSVSSRTQLTTLVQWGFVDAVEPIVTMSRVPSTEEWAQTLGYFAQRTADLTHKPDLKYSPYLVKPEP